MPDFVHDRLVDPTRVLWQVEHGFSNTDFNGLTYQQVMEGRARSGMTIEDLWPDMSNVDDAQQFIADMIQASGRLTMQRNIRLDPTKPKWARVCGGAKPCAFCVMLASRGFAYTSEETADFGSGFHDGHCHCSVVPSWGKDDILLQKQAEWKGMYDQAAQSARHAGEKMTPETISAWLRYNFPGLLRDGVVFDPDKRIPKGSKIERQLGPLNTLRINQMLKSTPHKDAARLWARHASDYLIRNPHHKGIAYFDRDDGGISIDVHALGLGDDSHRPYEVWFHESGHMLDWLLDKNDYSWQPHDGALFNDVLNRDAQNLYDGTEAVLMAQGLPADRPSVLWELRKQVVTGTEQSDRNIEDLLQAALGDDFPRGFGHDDGYFQQSSSMQSSEAFAEMIDSQLANPQAWALIANYFPESVKMFNTMIKEAAK